MAIKVGEAIACAGSIALSPQLHGRATGLHLGYLMASRWHRRPAPSRIMAGSHLSIAPRATKREMAACDGRRCAPLAMPGG